MTTVLILGLIVWLLTKILVESEVARPLRERAPSRFKLNYLVSCHLCSGVWIGLAVGVLHPAAGLGIWFSGLAYKAVAHVVLTVENLIERSARVGS